MKMIMRTMMTITMRKEAGLLDRGRYSRCMPKMLAIRVKGNSMVEIIVSALIT